MLFHDSAIVVAVEYRHRDRLTKRDTAPVAQWIEHNPPKVGVSRSNRLGRAKSLIQIGALFGADFYGIIRALST